MSVYKPLIEQTAQRYGVPVEIALAVAQHESSYNPNAVSPKGAIGIFQLMPGTANDLGVDPRNPEQNIDGGVRYLKQMYDRFGDWTLALAAYNAGPGKVQRAGNQIPAIPETRNYVSSIMASIGYGVNTHVKGDENSAPFVTAVVRGKLRVIKASIPLLGKTVLT